MEPDKTIDSPTRNRILLLLLKRLIALLIEGIEGDISPNNLKQASTI